MVNWLMHPDALGVVKTLFWGSVLMSLVSFLTDRHLYSLLKAHWKPICFCVALVLLWRIPTEGEFFHGTEYEDSYVYTVAGRQIAEHFRIEPGGPTLPYSINVCGVGSLTSCKQSYNYPEHLIGYPYILSVFFNTFGYRPSIGSIANVVCACLVDVLVFLLCIVIADDVIAALGAALIFAITPVFAVWGLETSAEPISNGCIILVLWFCLRYVFVGTGDRSRVNAFVTWCAFTSMLLLSLTVKRENILLPVVLPVMVFLVQFMNKRLASVSARRSWWMLLGAAFALMFSLQLRLFQTQSSQIALLKTFPLTAADLISYLPVFLGSFFVIQWYGGAVVLVLIGAIVAWRRKALALIPLSLFLGYVLLYAYHIRTYYEMWSGSTDSRAALRFSMSLMGMWSILAGLGTAWVFEWVRRTQAWKNHRVLGKWIAASIVVVIGGVSYFGTQYFREDVVADEFRMRIEPSLTAVRMAAQDQTKETYILTLEPLIPQMNAEPNVAVLNLHDVDDTVMKEIGFSVGMADVLYLDEAIHRTPADAERYKSQLAYLNQFQQSVQTSNTIFSVIRIRAVSAKNGLSQNH